MRKPPEIRKKRVVARTRMFCVEELDLEFENGTRESYERLQPNYQAAVLVVPVQDDGDTVLLIREYAAGTHRYELALPKGKMEDGEDVLEAADRELKEEVGYGANNLTHLKTFTVAPGLAGHLTEVVLAQGLYPEKLQGDEPEEIEVVPWSLNALDRLIEQSDCTEARSIAALYLAKDRLNTLA
jgi:ADP-ribose diphosphatase